MSSVKEYLLDLQEHAKTYWIQHRLGDDEADENTPGWAELEEEYAEIQEEKEREAEYQWYLENTYSVFYDQFNNELLDLKNVLKGGYSTETEEVILKMSYVHAVTILESFIGDYLKALLVDQDHLLNNLINSKSITNKNLNFGEGKYSLKDIYNSKSGIIGIVLNNLSKVSFHNINHVKILLKAIFNSDFKFETKEVGNIMSLRHHFVHRNGKDDKGNKIR